MGILGEIRLGEYNIHSIYDTAIESYDEGMVSHGDPWLMERPEHENALRRRIAELPPGHWVLISSEDGMERPEHDSSLEIVRGDSWSTYILKIKGRQVVFFDFIGEGGGLWYVIVPHDMVESWPRM